MNGLWFTPVTKYLNKTAHIQLQQIITTTGQQNWDCVVVDLQNPRVSRVNVSTGPFGKR